MATDTPTALPAPTRRRTRPVVYWVSTGAIAAEALAGGVLDLVRYGPYLRTLTDLGYPAYLATIMGVAKVASGVVVLAPGLPRLKEWAYAGVVFADTGAIASHLVVGYGIGEVAFLVPLAGLTVVSWSLRPASRRVPGRAGPTRIPVGRVTQP